MVIISNIAVLANNNLTKPNIILNDKSINTEAIIISNITYIPVRAISENIGGIVNWNEETKTAKIVYNNKEIEFNYYSGHVKIVDNITYLFNYYSVDIKMIDNIMYIPLRIVAQELELDIDWKAEDKTVIINTQSKDKEQLNVVNNSSSFAARLNNIMPENKNYNFSPLSLKYALAILANGADEQTSKEITTVLGIDDLKLFNDEVNAYLNKQQIKAIDEDINIGVNLNIANSLWLNQDYLNGGNFSDKYKAVIKEKYNGTAEVVNSNNAVEKINNWCYENTNHNIDSIIDNSDFQACLANAVYFNGKWISSFSLDNTKKDIFTDCNNKQIEIDFINESEAFYNYYQDSNIQILSLPYSGSSMSMYIALSNEKDIDFEKYIDKMKTCNVNVSIPKFEIEYFANMKEILKKIGIDSAFDIENPHFKNMFDNTVNESTNMFVSDILHKTYISIDEQGTEAAAITSVTMTGSLEEEEIEEKIYNFKANKPFTYFIRDDKTGDIIFMGRYVIAE